ncbi:hypothetical protein ACETRX_10240 [Labrys portucalensis]|uniref:DUF2569 domain-containing protein n=1 Tax=Labrys neptuniae TaxID=376174 RepID=A0ABV6ZD21_9HYPH
MALTGKQHERSLALGALVSSWTVPAGLPLLFVVLDLLAGGQDGIPDSQIAGVFAAFLMFGLPFTYAVTLILVMPVALWLRRKQSLSSARLCLWCILLGPITMYGYAWLLGGRPGELLEPEGLLLSAAYGLASGIVFCLVSGIRLVAR